MSAMHALRTAAPALGSQEFWWPEPLQSGPTPEWPPNLESNCSPHVALFKETLPRVSPKRQQCLLGKILSDASLQQILQCT